MGFKSENTQDLFFCQLGFVFDLVVKIFPNKPNYSKINQRINQK